ncbi:MAG: hypothetical protein ACTSO5_10530 [Candidatus Heimdallarchaeaceae archaeon]
MLQMRIHNKLLVLVLTALLLTSLSVRSETAPNLLELDEGITVVGDFHYYTALGPMTFTIDRIWHDSFFDLDVVEISRELIHTNLDPIVNVSREIVTAVVINSNRTNLIPVLRHYVKTWDDTIDIFLDVSESLNITSESLKVTVNGVTYVYDDMDPMSLVYSKISMWMMSWLLGNVLEQGLMPLTKYAISPNATTGQFIDYGPYQGEVMGFTEYYINEKEYYEVIEVHHDEVIIYVDILGDVDPYTIGESTYFYEKRTGMVLNWIEYDSIADENYYFNATEVTGINPLKTSVSFIVVLSTAIIAIPIVLARRKNK